jgi:hypothetical protein
MMELGGEQRKRLRLGINIRRIEEDRKPEFFQSDTPTARLFARILH